MTVMKILMLSLLVMAYVVSAPMVLYAAAIDYTFNLCDLQPNDCDGQNWITHPVQPHTGEHVTFQIDVDAVVAGDLCAVEFYAAYEASQMQFWNAKRSNPWPDVESPVACETVEWEWETPIGCPECDRGVHCYMTNGINHSSPKLDLEHYGGEIELDFRIPLSNDPKHFTGLFADIYWIDIYAGDTSTCNVTSDSGFAESPLGVLVTTLPEPGQGALLAFGIPWLVILAKRRHRHRRHDHA